MRHRFRLGRGARWLPALGATMALAAIPSVASASTSGAANTPNFDPQNTNTPYLAWNGEQLRLEKCVAADGLQASEFASIPASAALTVEDWSGSGTPDPTVQQPATLFYSSDFDHGAGGLCAKGEVLSMNPGLARIELDVTGLVGLNRFGDYTGPADPVLAHQFLAGWMTLNPPTLNEMGSQNFGVTEQSAAAQELGDPSGDGNFDAGGSSGYLDVHVTGTMPLSGSLGTLVGHPSVTLPNDWATLATALATDNQADNTTAYDDWDTSGDSGDTGGHSVTSPCLYGNPFGAPVFIGDSGNYVDPTLLDQGDNCNGGGADGAFSLATSGLSDAGTTIGPFDPVNASSTSLPDGDLNAQDAPMPAARVDMAIAPNSGQPSDISGVGSLEAANKVKTYSRDFEGDSYPTNLYAPFYDAYIPATARPTDDSSGVDGAYANNFPGFLNIPGDGSYSSYSPGSGQGLYHFWNTADLSQNIAQQTDCLNQGANPPSGEGTYRQTPSGPNDVAVYTDQNGEAQVQFVPGTGAYYDNLGADKNADGGCDLQDIYNHVLGTASITATAKYPYKPVDFPATTSDTVTKTVYSLFDKSLSYVPKGTSSGDANSRIVISHAQDVDGTPYAGETVCFSVDSNAEGVTRFTGYVNGVYYGGSQSTSDPNGSSQGRTCLITDANGNAAIEVLDSNKTTADVIADYVNEGLLRDIMVEFGTPGSTGGTPPTGPVSTPTPGAPAGSPKSATVIPPASGAAGTTAPSATTIARVDPKIAKHHGRKAKLAHVRFMRLQTPAGRAHYLVVRVASSHRSARLRLTLEVRRAGRMHIVRRTVTVRTNRMVKVHVARSVTKVKGARLAH